MHNTGSQHCRVVWYYLKPISSTVPPASYDSAGVCFIICFISLLCESLFVYMRGIGRFGDLSKLQQKVLQMGMSVISMLFNVERSPNVFVYVGQLICDSVRGRPTGRLKSLVMPEIIIMSLQLVSVEEQSMQRQVDTLTPAYAARLCVSFCIYSCVPWSG